MNLNQVTIYAAKPIETAEFFTKLGLVLIVDSLPRYARFECPEGDSTLSIQHDETARVSNNVILYFECDRLDEEVERLKSLGLTFDEEPTNQSWLWREARLRDPNGNKICLFHAADNRKNPPWRVK